jgi:hypothetical protein
VALSASTDKSSVPLKETGRGCCSTLMHCLASSGSSLCLPQPDCPGVRDVIGVLSLSKHGLCHFAIRGSAVRPQS